MPTPTCMSLSHHPNSNTKASIPYSHCLSSSVCKDSALTKKTFSCIVTGCLICSQPMDIPHQSLKMHWDTPNRSPGPMPSIQLHQLRTEDPSSLCFTIHIKLPAYQILQSNWHILQNSTTVGTAFCDRPLVAFKKDQNLHEILVHSNLHSQANSTPGTFPCSTDRCNMCPHLCADTSIRGPNGHIYVYQEDFDMPEWQPGICHHLSILQPHLCWWDFQVPCGSFFRTSDWCPPQPQQTCSPTL